MSVLSYRIETGDSLTRLAQLPPDSVQCVVTSPPYWRLRDYAVEGQIGLEATPEAFVDRLVEVFREVRRVLRTDGTLWLNLGDTYAGGGKGGGGIFMLKRKGTAWGKQSKQRGHWPPPSGLKAKDLVGIPWRVAFALQADGWCLRSDIIWAKPNPMPESITDRPAKAHEYLFLLTKSGRYFYDAAAIAEPLKHPEASTAADVARAFSRRRAAAPETRQLHAEVDGQPKTTRNKRSVWTIAPQPLAEAHFATFPEDLVRPCILAGSRPGDVVLDPFTGSGTTGVVALKQGRSFWGVELNPEYVAIAERRLGDAAPLLARRIGGAP